MSVHLHLPVGASLGILVSLSEWLMLIPLICLCLLWCLMYPSFFFSIFFPSSYSCPVILVKNFFLSTWNKSAISVWDAGNLMNIFFPNLIVDGCSKCSCQVFGIYCFKVRMVWSGKHIVHGPLFKHLFICQTYLAKCEVSWVTKSSMYLKLH